MKSIKQIITTIILAAIILNGLGIREVFAEEQTQNQNAAAEESRDKNGLGNESNREIVKPDFLGQKHDGDDDTLVQQKNFEPLGFCDAFHIKRDENYNGKTSTITCPGPASAAIDLKFSSGKGESCVYIDNKSPKEISYFVPMNSKGEWDAFKQSTLKDGALDKEVVISYGCKTERLSDSCGGTGSSGDARNGTVIALEPTPFKKIKYICQGSPSCGRWVELAQEGSCPINGQCGMQTKAPQYTTEGLTLCAAGEQKDLQGSGPWEWDCKGQFGGKDIHCTMDNKVDGACGTDAGKSSYTLPTQLCAKGKASAVSGDGPWSWTCHGKNGQEIQCASNKTIDGVCGSDDGIGLTAPPTNLCITGTPTPVSGNGPWNWRCVGVLNGISSDCSAKPVEGCKNVSVISLPDDTQFTQIGEKRWRYGAIGDNYWNGYCTNFSRQLVFKIGDVRGVHKFKLVWGGWDDWMNVKLNENLIVSVPYAHPVDSIPACELSTSWSFDINPNSWGYMGPQGGNPHGFPVYGNGVISLNDGGGNLASGFVTYDLEPYLVNGTNILQMDVNVAGGGEGWIDLIIDTDENYCPDHPPEPAPNCTPHIEQVSGACPTGYEGSQIKFINHLCDGTNNGAGQEFITTGGYCELPPPPSDPERNDNGL